MESCPRVIAAGRFESTMMSATSGANHQLALRRITEERENEMHSCERPNLANIYRLFSETHEQAHMDKSAELK